MGLILVVATLVVLGWGVTWWARRQAGRALADGAAEPSMLVGAQLWAVRAVWLILAVAVSVVYAYALAVVWREANEIYYPRPYAEILETGFLGLTPREQALLGSFGDTPGWYPWLVVVREATVFLAALAIAWSVFARRPRHWMAYFVAGLVAVGPMGYLGGVRSRPTLVGDLAHILSIVLVVGALGFLWMFPDGRFRWTYLRYLGFLFAAWAVAHLLVRAFGGETGDMSWTAILLGFFLLVSGGVATQVWRYRHLPLSSKRLSRWNLAILCAIPVCFWFYFLVYFAFERGSSIAAFVWHQVFLTLYLAAPVLLGLWILYLMRSQGWWDAQRFWRRTTVFVVLAPLFVVAYVGVLVAVGVMAQAITGGKNQTLGVLLATAAVAFAFRPVQGVVAGWVDRRFFPTRRMADETVARFTDRVRQEADPASVRDELLAVVHDTLNPEQAVVWVAGREVP
jgi:hypothetical protein